jgi:hypothetical protein
MVHSISGAILERLGRSSLGVAQPVRMAGRKFLYSLSRAPSE